MFVLNARLFFYCAHGMDNQRLSDSFLFAYNLRSFISFGILINFSKRVSKAQKS